MYINYEYYRIFYFVAKYQNFTQAANILMSNQPNVTRSMKKLENELGCRLFIRSNRGVTLTPEGEKLYARVSAAVEQLQAGEEELAKDASLQSGVVSIGVSETALHVLLLPVLRQFHKAYPGIHIRISNHSTPQAISALKNGLIDFAVVSTPTGISRPLEEIPVMPFQDILVCGPSYEFLTKKRQSLKDLKPYPFVCLGRETKTFEFYNALFLKHGLLLEPDMEAATTAQLLPMIKYDLGIGFLPESFAQAALREGEIYKISLKEEIPERAICVIHNTGRSLSVAAKELERVLRERKM